MSKINIAVAPKRESPGYPSPFDASYAQGIRQRLGNAGGVIPQ
jgi:uncharacterized cupin superfamily protein